MNYTIRLFSRKSEINSVKGDRVAGVSYALYRMSIFQLCLFLMLSSSFIESNSQRLNRLFCISIVSVCVMCVAVGRVIQKLPDGERIAGVTSLDNLLYVLRSTPAGQIEVYDTKSYRLQRHLSVPGLRTGRDMTACSRNRCAYISDGGNKCVHRLALPGADAKTWPVGDIPYCVSVTDKHSVLVTCDRVRKIKEFSTDGKLLNEVSVAQDVVSPGHTIQSFSDEFIVCHGGDYNAVHRVCLVDYDGQVVKAFGGSKGSDSQQMNHPVHLAFDKNKFVFVADYNNHRVLLLSPAMDYVHEVVARDKLNGLPTRLCLNADKTCLYIAVNNVMSGRVVVVKV